MKIDVFGKEHIGNIKPMHGVNNGPTEGTSFEKRGNFEAFAALKIPFVRNHDASLSEAYGSQHLVDVHCIFPDFRRDPNDPEAYDFVLTDVYTETIVKAGAKVFYRLGSSIEHWARKYGTRKPEDYGKWVDVCEHIIMHYTEGWANGFFYDISYWEIWNEPDLDPDGAPNKRTWGGTRAEFFDLFELAAKRLKARFPHLRIGGPAIAGKEDWANDFLEKMNRRAVPIDFFSWHIYTTDPKRVLARAQKMRALMQKHGYGEAESILNEWNYVSSWSDPLHYIRVIKGLKGASFNCAVMCEMQTNSDVDALMYYDARVEKIWNGLFDSDTLLPIKGYYSFRAFGEVYQTKEAVRLACDDTQIYACAACSDERLVVLLTNYANEEPAEKQISLHLHGLEKTNGVAKIYTLSETSDLCLTEEQRLEGGALQLHIPAYNVLLVEIDISE